MKYFNEGVLMGTLVVMNRKQGGMNGMKDMKLGTGGYKKVKTWSQSAGGSYYSKHNMHKW